MFHPTNSPGPLGINDHADPNPGQLYRDQLRQLNTEVGKRLRARAISYWAIHFFQANPYIHEIAKALTQKVDSALFAVNRLAETFQAGSIFDFTNWTGWFPERSFRGSIDKTADMYLKRSFTPWLITYRIPRAVAVAVQAVEDKRGLCEEHAFLAIYLLTLGHMIQNMPFGRLKRDIYYTAAATKKHAMVILVKGAEFKTAVIESKIGTGKINAEWLRTHPEEWGESAWIADGWSGKAKKLSGQKISFDYVKTQTYRRDPKSGAISKWDATVRQMAERVAKDYRIP